MNAVSNPGHDQRDGGRSMRAGEATCRLCGLATLFPVLDLGRTPIANALLEPDDTTPSATYPLALVGCETCGLVQLAEDLPAGVIFDESYRYLSSYSQFLLEHSRTHALDLMAEFELGSESFVVEVASNDGYLLRNFVDKGVRCLGVEPSPKPAALAREVGVPTEELFLGERIGRQIAERHGRADVVIANNVLAHVPDINDFFAGLVAILAETGVLTIENPQIRALVDNTLFDTIYHEHYSYLSCTAIVNLARRHGLYLNDVTEFPDLHGSTLRWTLSRTDSQSATAQRLLTEESAVGVTRPAYYAEFSSRVHAAQTELRLHLENFKAAGKRVAAYGCAAKGATLLNSAGIGTELIEYVVDLNPEKQGKLMPGCRLPCRAPSWLLTDSPDVVVILAWNFAEEIIRQQAEYQAAGGVFLVPLPVPTIVE